MSLMRASAEESVPILPNFITLSNFENKYLSRYTDKQVNGLQFIKTEPDAFCTFEVTYYRDTELFSLKAENGKYINVETDGSTFWLRCNGDTSIDKFRLVHIKGNELYLRSTSTYPVLFVRSRQHPSKDGLDTTSYAKSDCVLTLSEPIVRKELLSLVYDLPNPVLWDVPPVIALNTTVRNDSKSSEVQQTLAYSYTRSKVGTWNNAAGVELGASMSFEAGVPFIATATFEVSVSASYTHEWGGSEGSEETITSSTQITVPPGKKGKAIILVRRKGIDIHFTYKQKFVYKDGRIEINDNKRGVYRNVESYAVDVQVGDWEDA